MQHFLDWLFAAKGQAALAGAAGGIVRWLTAKDSLGQGVASIITGALCAVYLTPIVDPVFAPIIGKLAPEADASAGLAGFVIGVGGMTVVGFIMDVWNRKRNSAND